MTSSDSGTSTNADVECRRHRGNRAGREHAVVECQRFVIGDGGIVAFQPQRRAVLEHAAGVDYLDIAALGNLFETAGKRGNDLLFSLADFVDIELRRRIIDAPVVPQLIDFGNDASHVQQGLRWNTAAKQTRPAEPRIGLDECYFQAFIGGEERRGIAARTAAEDNDGGVHEKTENDQ